MAARLCSGEIICNVDADNFTGPGYAQYIDEQMKDKDLPCRLRLQGWRLHPDRW